MKASARIFICLLLIIPVNGNGQTKDSLTAPALKLDLAVFDLPYQFEAARAVNADEMSFGGFLKGYANPGMSQSLALTTDLYSAVHYGLGKAFVKKKQFYSDFRIFLEYTSYLASDFILMYAPLGDGWLHEEYHRAVMSRFNINSFNDMNTFPLGAEIVSVNHVSDEDLIRFKNESPADFIRMHVAGIEGEYLLIDKLEKNNFFYGQGLVNEILYLLSTLNSISYVNICTQPGYIDEETDRMNSIETLIPDRDFTGFDFTAWVYDLYNPEEPYVDRGVHPSGTGIDRYIKTTDLSEEQLAYLKKQGSLQLLNMLSPMLYTVKTIPLKNGMNFNFAFRHFLTSFGSDISFNLFLKTGNQNLILAYHHANNYVKAYPSIEASIFEQTVNIRNNTFLLTPRFIAGIQPKEQEFNTRSAGFLGYFGCRLDWITSKVYPWIELEAKSKGWVAGNEYLDSNLKFKAGISARF